METRRFRLATAVCLISQLLCRCSLTAGVGDPAAAALAHCGHPEYREVCFEDSVKSKLVYAEFEPAVLRCVVRNLGKHVVAWMRNDGGEIPLTVGKTTFTTDKRVMIDYSSPDEWNLVIRGAHVQDSGEYLCQVNSDSGLMEKSFRLVVKESDSALLVTDKPQPWPAPKNKPTGGSIVVPGRSSKTLLNDESVSARQELIKQTKNVHIYGRKLVFNGEQFVSLTCTAVFRTANAKQNSAATVEWYHQGLRQASNASSMDVSMSWKDGDTAVSVLTLYSVVLSHAGEWICLKRPSEVADGLETSSHHLTVLERENQQQHPQQRTRQHQQQQRQQTGGHVESLGLGSGAVSAAVPLGAAVTSLLVLIGLSHAWASL